MTILSKRFPDTGVTVDLRRERRPNMVLDPVEEGLGHAVEVPVLCEAKGFLSHRFSVEE